MNGLHAEVAVRRAGFALEAELQVGLGEVVAVLGRNGSGKSTLLGAIAGLLRPDSGRVSLDGRVLTDTASGVQVPPHRRRIGLLAQRPLLFPHLSVLENVAFGPRSAGVPRSQARERARRRLAEVDAGEFAQRRPARLSGGQAQRVAVARALAADPDLLLLDEPLSAVDIDLAPQLRALLRSLLWDRLAVVVTHQALDALVLADRVVVLEAGRVVEQGPTMEVLSRPRSPFAARLAGLNLVPGTAVDGGLRTENGTEIAGRGNASAGEAAVAVFSPMAVAVHVQRPQGSPRNAVADRVTGLEPQGDLVRVRSAGGLAADVTPPAVAELGLHPGMDVWFVVKATEVAVHPSADPRSDGRARAAGGDAPARPFTTRRA
ncbi:MAG: sulfate/molybdate ABC transporter ATP-binding protein [Pseudonocardiaceae bacterium]